MTSISFRSHKFFANLCIHHCLATITELVNSKTIVDAYIETTTQIGQLLQHFWLFYIAHLDMVKL